MSLCLIFKRLNRFFQLLGAVGRLESSDEVGQAVSQKHAVVGAVVADAMIGDAVLGAVIGAHLLGAVAGTNLDRKSVV